MIILKENTIGRPVFLGMRRDDNCTTEEIRIILRDYIMTSDNTSHGTNIKPHICSLVDIFDIK